MTCTCGAGAGEGARACSFSARAARIAAWRAVPGRVGAGAGAGRGVDLRLTSFVRSATVLL